MKSRYTLTISQGSSNVVRLKGKTAYEIRSMISSSGWHIESELSKNNLNVEVNITSQNNVNLIEKTLSAREFLIDLSYI